MPSRPSNKRDDILADCNAKLSAQVQVQRNEINQLEDKIKELELDKQDWQETLVCLHRLWEELNASISFLEFMAKGTVGVNVNENTDAADDEFLEQANPFLAKLLSSYTHDLSKPHTTAVKTAHDTLSEDLSDIEVELRKKMVATLNAAKGVLEAIEQQQGSTAEATAGDVAVEGGSPVASTPRAAASVEAQLLAMVTLLKAENERLRDDRLHDKNRIKDLSTQLADKEDELSVANRKLIQLKDSSTRVGSAGVKSEGAPPGQPINGAPGGSSAGVKKEEEDLTVDVAEVEALNKLLEERSAEVDEKEAALMKSERKVRELADRVESEKKNAARAREYHKARVHELEANLDGMQRRLANVERDRDVLGSRNHEMQYQLDQSAHALRQLDAAAAHIRDLESRLSSTQNAQRAAESELIAERGRRSNVSTVAELKKGLEALQKDVARLRGVAEKHKSAAQGAAAAQGEAAAARRQLEESQGQLTVAKQRLETARAAIKAHAEQTRAWRHRETELQLFAEVSFAALGASPSEKEVHRLKASHAALEQKVQQLTEDIENGAEKAARIAAEESSQQLQSQMEALEESNAALTAGTAVLEQRVKQLEEDVAAAKAESDNIMAEMDSILEDAEVAKAHNKSLMEAITVRDDDNAKLAMEAAEAARQKTEAGEIADEAMVAKERAERAAGIFQTRIVDLELRIAAMAGDLDKAQDAARAAGAQRDDRTREAEASRAERDRAEAEKKAVEEEMKKFSEDRDAEADKAKLQASRADRLQREVQEYKERLDRLKRGGQDGVAEEVQAEASALRKMINCNVCHVRQKDVIITKCNHLFCNHCVKANLNSRNRKCPGCGIKFGEADVRPFYFT